MDTKRNFIILLMCILLTLTIATSVQAQEEEIPDWAKDYTSFIPFFESFFAMGLLLCLFVCLIIPLIIAILICVWIYKDAEKRGKQGILWVILLILATIFFNILGLIVVIVIWLLVRPPLKG